MGLRRWACIYVNLLVASLRGNVFSILAETQWFGDRNGYSSISFVGMGYLIALSFYRVYARVVCSSFRFWRCFPCHLDMIICMIYLMGLDLVARGISS